LQELVLSHQPYPAPPDRSPITRRALSLPSVAVLAVLTCMPAKALTINAIYGPGISPAAQSVISSTILGYESLFTDNVAISIDFQSMTGGLGQSSTYVYTVSYSSFISGLRADATSISDSTAIALLPQASTDPVAHQGSVRLTRANAQAVGLSVNPPPNNDTDSTISLNLSIINIGRSSIDPARYDLQSVVSHEIDEVLGTTSNVGGNGTINPADLFRYSASGQRSFTKAGDDAYFSLDGSTLLARYNQDGSADYGDWWSTGAHAFEVQDAYGTPGAFANLSTELTLLDAVGYTLAVAVPETGSLAMLAAGLAWVGGIVRRKTAAGR
jgi:hypothetical protein